ncbi:GNAT family N-acetyltransferase [Pseudoroseicyclus tamaricis]|uniref:N-acetyltransferase n=1 Tax=Pseudoroseicyclus tamaricis TaxID=2705421 RepID=A0A6B2JS11_9RHOB|nr:GNAT family N-acetyltransferase [Pseudoroseicyclus tamaricis]NDV00998.1 N-acetyltransferase [Pseudoroseicyclus tamaricis]
MIRVATHADIPALANIWNPIIRETTVIFSEEQKTPEWIAEAISTRPAFLVAEEQGSPVGLATFGPFRSLSGYAATVEHTLLLAPEARGRGVGRQLMQALEAQARERGAHVMVGVISGENHGALAFHAALGFQEAGRLKEAGRKFGRWLDAVFMQKIL